MLKRLISTTTRYGYGRIAKPVLFRKSPDTVHDGLIKLGGVTQQLPLVRHAPTLWSYRNDEMLSQEILGRHLISPIGLSAGFDKNARLVPTMSRIGLGFMVAGTVTRDPCEGNPKPWFYRLPKTKSLVVHAGLPNEGHVQIDQRIREYSPKLFENFSLSVSAGKTNSPEVVTVGEGIRDYITSMGAFDKNDNVQWHEINISCPNTYGGEPFTSPARLGKLLKAVDETKLTKPVIIKMPIDQPWSEFKKLLDVILKHNVQGVSIGNLNKLPRDQLDLKDPLPDEVKGNLSGLPNQQITTELIRQSYAYCGDGLVIIGVGGVFNAQDAYAKIRAGASLVAMITGIIFEGPQVVGEINRGLVELLKSDGFSSISDAIGADHQ